MSLGLLTRYGMTKAAGAPPGGTASFVQGGDVTPVVATSISVTLPGSLVDGNLLVLFVAGRSTITTPTGFALVATTPTAASFSGRMVMLTKTISGDASATVTVTQAASGRMGLAWAEVSASGGTPIVEDNATAGPSTVNPVSMAVATASGADRVALAGGWNEYAATGGVATAYTVSSPWSLVSTASRAENRLFLGRRDISSASIGGSFESSAGSPYEFVVGSLVLRSP